MIEPVLTRKDPNKKHLSDKGLKDFFDYCCLTRYYFSLSKSVVKRDVGYASLYICLNVSLEKIKHLPDPMLGEKDHYLPFCDAFKKKTTERDRPSLATRSQNHYHSQHVYNTSTILESCCKVKNSTFGGSCTQSVNCLFKTKLKFSIYLMTWLTHVAQPYKILTFLRSSHVCIRT